jgi:hypothetical protein
MQTKDGFELVLEDTTALLEETGAVVFYRLCTAYDYHSYVLRFEVSGDDFTRTFKTEPAARTFFDSVKN